MPQRIITGLRDTILSGITGPICLRECINVTIDRPKINGGHWVLVEMERCKGCSVTLGTLSNPSPHPEDATPDDACSHCIQMIGCRDCTAIDVTCASRIPIGDAVNLWNCLGCVADHCIVKAKLSQMACAAIIDGPKGRGNTIRRMQVRGPVNVCGGGGHILSELRCSSVQVTGEYYKAQTSASLFAVRASVLYVGPNGKVLSRKGCKFNRVE